MLAYTYTEEGKFELTEKDKPKILNSRDAIVKITLASICSSDLHIKHGSVPRAVMGITVGHEIVGIAEEVGELEENGVVMFPDAPTERGVKHIKELCKCVKDGYEAYIFFIVQMKNCSFLHLFLFHRASI